MPSPERAEPHEQGRRPAPRPTELEALANTMLGRHPAAMPFPEPVSDSVLAAMERAMLPALERPPCLVSFSGGRDSSVVLAVAVRAARRHGLEDPVPAIMRFRDVPESEETEWQRLVLAHLRLERYEVLDLKEELDMLGTAATTMLEREGPRAPANAYMHTPIVELARGGAVMTGAGGDEVFITTGSRHILLLRRRARPALGDWRTIASALAPQRLRAFVAGRRALDRPWLTEAGRTRVAKALAGDAVLWPHRWDKAIRYWYETRSFTALDGALSSMAAVNDVKVVNPFMEPGVLAELAEAGGPAGFPTRAEGMRRLFGDLLPERLISRESKASFSRAVWGPKARAFASSWTGAGADRRFVDVEALRREWLEDRPNAQTGLLLHHIWASQHAPGTQTSASSS